MYLYSWPNLVMAARVFHSTNISELAEAFELEDDDRAEHRGSGDRKKTAKTD